MIQNPLLRYPKTLKYGLPICPAFNQLLHWKCYARPSEKDLYLPSSTCILISKMWVTQIRNESFSFILLFTKLNNVSLVQPFNQWHLVLKQNSLKPVRIFSFPSLAVTRLFKLCKKLNHELDFRPSTKNLYFCYIDFYSNFQNMIHGNTTNTYFIHSASNWKWKCSFLVLPSC